MSEITPPSLDQLSAALLLLEADGTIVYANLAATSALGKSPQRLLGLNLCTLLGEEADFATDLTQAAAGETRIHHNSRWQLPGEQSLTLDYRLTPQEQHLLLEFQPRDRALELDAQARDRAEQATRRLLLRGLAHEIKNPLGGIRGAAQLLEMELADPEQREYTQVIMQEVDRLGRLVDRMLGPRQLPRRVAVNIHQLLERVRLLLAHSPEFTHIAWQRDYDPSLPELEGDPEQLQQVLLNLARNACQSLAATPTPEARILLRTRILRQVTLGRQRHRLACLVEVEDNGPGVPEALKERLFYPMISGRAEGSGLGLSLAQGIVQQHGGALHCQSEPGCCRFSLCLPFHPLQEPRA